MSFEFKGRLPSSKSLVNRWLILAGHFPQIHLNYQTMADDVVYLEKALSEFRKGRKKFYVGKGGTTFRFLALFLSRYPGEYLIEVDPQLRNRSPASISEVLSQLGVVTEWDGNIFRIQTSGWQNYEVSVSTQTTSQVLTSVLLSCWNLDQEFSLKFENPKLSNDYFEMTLDVLRLADLNFKYVSKDTSGVEISIEKGQFPQEKGVSVESDVSSAFAVAAMAVADGMAFIEDFPFSSRQPDIEFVSLFEKMGVCLEKGMTHLKVSRTEELKPLEVHIGNSPDLFPVLAVLCAHANGKSRIYGAPHLKNKESNRIESVSALLMSMRVRFEPLDDGIIIFGNARSVTSLETRIARSYSDHRLVMAAAVAKRFGHNLTVDHPEEVYKSFPEFYHLGAVQW